MTQLNPISNKKLFERLNVIYRVLTQQREDKHKVYSIHELAVPCIAKGKEHKPYEFGNKSSFAYTRKSGILVGAIAFEENTSDGHTLKSQLIQVRKLTAGITKKAIVDKCYKIKEKIGSIEIIMPIKNMKGAITRKNNWRPVVDPAQA